jgi:beta-mannosidase
LQPVSVQIRVRMLDFAGKTLLDKLQDVKVAPQSSAVYFSLSAKELLATASPDQTFVSFELNTYGRNVAHNLLFFDTMRNLNLPPNPAIESHVTAQGRDYAITLCSPVLARNVFLSFDALADTNVQLSDNYFDLLPGETVTVLAKTTATLDQVNHAMKIISLTDAFYSPKPDYRSHAH